MPAPRAFWPVSFLAYAYLTSTDVKGAEFLPKICFGILFYFFNPAPESASHDEDMIKRQNEGDGRQQRA